jgi:hypothetical protein
MKEYRVLHTHQLNPWSYWNFARKSDELPGHMQDYETFLSERKEEDEIVLVVPVRKPMGRNVFAFFENLSRYGIASHAKQSIEDVIKIFLSKYPHKVPITWFDNEVETPLGIDVPSLGLDAGEVSVQLGKRLLVVRAEETRTM